MKILFQYLVHNSRLGYSPLKRRTWKPTVKQIPANRPKNNRTITKFGGKEPYLNGPWPLCPQCDKPQTFLCQLNISDIPKDVQTRIGLKSGLFQAFHCFRNLPDCAAHVDGDPFKVAWIIPESEIEVIPTLRFMASHAIVKNSLSTQRLPKTLKESIDAMIEMGE